MDSTSKPESQTEDQDVAQDEQQGERGVSPLKAVLPVARAVHDPRLRHTPDEAAKRRRRRPE